MAMFVLLEDLITMRVTFSCVLMEHGDMSVITIGMLMMLKLSAHNLATLKQVS